MCIRDSQRYGTLTWLSALEAWARAEIAWARQDWSSATGHAAKMIDISVTVEHEQLACLVVVNTPWTVENDLVTPTFKVKRNRIEDIYAAQYERWEDYGQKIIWESA